ncbi:MAG: DUF6279 family lipoprotein [Pseudomonadota bacterium]
MIVIRIQLLVFGALLLAACSSTSLIYNNASWFIESQIDDYFSLNNDQEESLGQALDEFFQWHRTRELPGYADALERLSVDLSDGLERSELQAFFIDINDARLRLVEQVAQPASAFLVTVGESQLEQFDAEFQEQIDERAKELERSPDESAEARFEGFLDQLEGWFGEFNDSQKARIREISDAWPDRSDYWLEVRRQRHKQFMQLMRADPTETEIAQYIRDRFIHRRFSTDQELATIERSRAEWIDALLEVDSLLTSLQRRRAISEMQDYRDDFRELSQEDVADKRASAAGVDN